MKNMQQPLCDVLKTPLDFPQSGESLVDKTRFLFSACLKAEIHQDKRFDSIFQTISDIPAERELSIVQLCDFIKFALPKQTKMAKELCHMIKLSHDQRISNSYSVSSNWFGC